MISDEIPTFTKKEVLDMVNHVGDPVMHPAHYDRGNCPACGTPIETRFVIEDMTYFRGAAVKYEIRAGRKNPDKELEDIRKAIQCLQFEAERIERLSHDA